MAFKACDDTRGGIGRGRFFDGHHRTVFGAYGICAVLAGASLLALASCSATSDPILQLGIAPEQLARAEKGDDTDEAPEAAVSQTDGAAKDAASGSEDEGDAAKVASTTREKTPSGSAKEAEETKKKPDGQPVATADATSGEENPAEESEQSADSSEMANTGDDAKAEKRRSFLSAFFSPSPTRATAATRAIAETTTPRKPARDPGKEARRKEPKEVAEADGAKQEGKPLVDLASNEPAHAPIVGAAALPGVRGGDSLFEISHKSGIEDNSTIDVYEDVGSYQVASAGGMARLAPNGLVVQREGVDVSCFKPNLVRALKAIERHYGRRLVVTSGYRSPAHNRRVNGARHSLHMACAAADIQMAGVSKWELAKFARSMPGRGGVGTYCHTNSIHVDVGRQRDWNWRCNRRRK